MFVCVCHILSCQGLVHYLCVLSPDLESVPLKSIVFSYRICVHVFDALFIWILVASTCMRLKFICRFSVGCNLSLSLFLSLSPPYTHHNPEFSAQCSRRLKAWLLLLVSQAPSSVARCPDTTAVHSTLLCRAENLGYPVWES